MGGVVDLGRYYVGSNTNQTYYISHHGILGQKWGVRRFQNKDGTRTAAGRERYGSGEKNSASGKSSKCPPDMKKDILAVNGGTNSNWNSPMRHNNCAFCSVAYEMRRRGENVRAQESLDGVTQDAIQKAVKNLKQTDIKTFAERTSLQSKSIGMSKDEFNDLTATILKDGENSRGQMTVKWKAQGETGRFCGGHALNYEVKDGTFYLVDSQVGKAYSGKDAYNYLSNACNVKTFRTDNKKFDTKITEKYYTEKNEGKIKGLVSRHAANVINGIGGTVAGVGAIVSYGSLYIGYLPGLLAGAGIMAVGGTIAVPGMIFESSASTKEKEQMLALEKKWQAEDRMNFYNTIARKKGEGKR